MPLQELLKNMAQIVKINQNNDYNFTPPTVWSNCNDKNSYKYPNFIFRHMPNPLWGIIPSPTVFPKDQAPFCSHQSHSIPTTQQSLFRQRFRPRHPLPNHPWTGKDRNQCAPETERCLPICGQSSHLSRSNHSEEVSGTFWISRPHLLPKPPRSIPKLFPDETRSSLLCDLRSRYQGPYGLRSTGRSQGRLQSKETGTAFLSTPSLLRRQNRRYLGRSLSLGRYPSCTPYHRSSEEKSLKASLRNSRDSHPGRFGLLRPYNRRISSGNSSLLCHCGSNHQADPTSLWGSSLRGGHSWSLGLGIRIQTLAMENRSAIHSRSTSSSREAFLATLPLPDEGIYLPGDCYQPPPEASQPLAILQPESHGRTYYSGASGSLYPGENSFKRLGFQSSLFPSGSPCLQPDQLVQTSLFPCRLAAPQPSDDSKPVILSARPIDPPSRKTHVKFTEQLSILKNIYANFTEYQ